MKKKQVLWFFGSLTLLSAGYVAWCYALNLDGRAGAGAVGDPVWLDQVGPAPAFVEAGVVLAAAAL
jgi:hypothetical protein